MNERALLPACLVFFGEPDQVLDLELLAGIRDGCAGIATEHLVHFAGDQHQVGAGGAVDEGDEIERQAALVVGKFPGFHIVAGDIVEAHLVQLVEAPIQQDAIFGGLRGIAKAAAQVQPEPAPIGQEAGGAGPIPVALVSPDAAPPV